jgi:hypothetical protein
MFVLASVVTSWDLLGVAVAAGVFVVGVLVIGAGARRAKRAPNRAHSGSIGPAPSGLASSVDRGQATEECEAAPKPQAPAAGDCLPGLSRRQLVERGAIGLLVASLAGVLTSAVDYVGLAACPRRIGADAVL